MPKASCFPHIAPVGQGGEVVLHNLAAVLADVPRVGSLRQGGRIACSVALAEYAVARCMGIPHALHSSGAQRAACKTDIKPLPIRQQALQLGCNRQTPSATHTP